MGVFYLVYLVEYTLRVLAYGSEVLKHKSAIMDLVVLVVSTVDYAMKIFVSEAGDGSILSILRLLRLCRLPRLMRATTFLAGVKELRRLVQMMMTCAKTLFWSFLMCFLVMSIWGVMAVELVHPVAQELAEKGTWGDCERCGRAFESVLAANLTFFSNHTCWG